MVVPNVYFPKYVAIENKRLWFMQLVANVFVILLVVGIVVSNLFPEVGEPEIRLSSSINGWQGIAASDSSALCSSDLTSLYDYSLGEASAWRMENTACAQWCSQAPNDPSCIREGDVSVTDIGHDMFVATSYTEELHLLSDSCPYSLDADGECKKKSSYIIPGVEQARAQMDISYQIRIPDSFYHKYSGQEHITTTDLRTVVQSADGTVYKEFGSDEMVTLTVAEALAAARFDSAGLDARPSDARGGELPSSSAAGTSARPAARVTGLDIVMTIEIGNKIIKPFGDPTCVITVDAVQTWSSRQVVSTVDMDGSVRARTYNGIRFKLHTQGTFQWPQLFQIAYAICLAVAWMRIPFVLVFYFAVCMLGGLSDVYNGFLYQVLDFRKEFTGVCARMLKTSYAFTDLHDLEEEEKCNEDDDSWDVVWGISRERVAKRMETIFSGTELGQDKTKLELFVKFFFDHSAGRAPRLQDVTPQGGLIDDEEQEEEERTAAPPSRCSLFAPPQKWSRPARKLGDNVAIQLDDFIKIFGSKEDLLWDDIVHIFNSEEIQNTLEKLFMDSTLKGFYEKEMRIGHKDKMQYKFDKTQKKQWDDAEEANKRENAEKALKQHRNLSELTQQSNLVRSMYAQAFLEERLLTLECAGRSVVVKRRGGVVAGLSGEGEGEDEEEVATSI